MTPEPHSSAAPGESRHTGWMILGLLAIPFVTVSGVALSADVASTTDPAAAAIGIPALLGGVMVGALVFHVARVMHSGAVALCGALLAVIDHRVSAVADLMVRCAPRTAIRPAVVLVPASVGRRGPPLSSR